LIRRNRAAAPRSKEKQLHRPAVCRHQLCTGRRLSSAKQESVFARDSFSRQAQEKQMKIATLIARYLLALIFLVFGMNHCLNFIPMGPIPAGIAGQFFGALLVSRYLYVVAFFEVAPAILLLINRYVPLALVVLGPVIVNIFLTGLLISTVALPMAILLVILWLLATWPVRSVFFPLLRQRVAD
jgi:putative oxidoreductase